MEITALVGILINRLIMKGRILLVDDKYVGNVLGGGDVK